ncbi:hypothetical protein Tco_1414639, partial [Tanacetum coccineum]
MWVADHVVALTLCSIITIPEIPNEFAIKGNHLTLVKGNQFDGRTKTDPHRNTENEVVRLMMFPLSLTGEAKAWLDELSEGTIKINFHGHNLSKGNIIKIFYHGLNKITQEVLNAAAGGIFLYKTPNQAYQLLEDKVLLKFDWDKIQKTKSSFKKIVTFVDEDIIDEILEEYFDALLDEGSKILHSIKGTILEEEIFSEFDTFIAMAANENYESKSDEEEPKF